MNCLYSIMPMIVTIVKGWITFLLFISKFLKLGYKFLLCYLLLFIPFVKQKDLLITILYNYLKCLPLLLAELRLKQKQYFQLFFHKYIKITNFIKFNLFIEEFYLLNQKQSIQKFFLISSEVVDFICRQQRKTFLCKQVHDQSIVILSYQ